MVVLIQEVKEQDGEKKSGTCNLAVLSEHETIPLKQLYIKLKW